MTYRSVIPWARLVGVAACALAMSASSTAAAQSREVQMVANAYTPATLTIPAGTPIRFVNRDGEIHTVSQQGGGFDSGLLFPGDSWTYAFDRPGTYAYFCLPHPFMVGTVIVD